MRWLWGNDLRRRGILGMNARNARVIAGRNPRALYPVVDDKLLLGEFCSRVNLPTPEILATFERHGDLRHLAESLEASPDCVIKPARGSSGRGILILTGKNSDGYRRHHGRSIGLSEIRSMLCDILSGMYSLGGRPDRAMIQRRVRPHPTLENICFRGTPDVRILVYRGVPAMAMLRLPTLESNGKANLHQGGIGLGIEMSCGRTTKAIHRGRAIDRHPDTGERLIDREIPKWEAVIELARRTARVTGLGYVGADVVIDEAHGPLLLEANARPGLAIQMANGQGLLPILDSIDWQPEITSPKVPADAGHPIPGTSVRS